MQRSIYFLLIELGNYFPMVSRAYIKDLLQDVQLTLLSDNSHGCGSNAEGQLEVMLHRRCLTDDGRGVGEVLNETTHIQPGLWVILSAIEEAAGNRIKISLMIRTPSSSLYQTKFPTGSCACRLFEFKFPAFCYEFASIKRPFA